MKLTLLDQASRGTIIVSVASLSLLSPSLAASFSVPPDSATTAKTVANNETGFVGIGNTLSVTGTAITWMTGASAPGVVVTNNGTIAATVRAIDTATAALNGNFTLQNNAGATLTSANDAFRIQSATVGTVTVNNLGTIQTTTNGRALDFNAVTSTASIFTLTNGANATIRAVGNDGIRIGTGATTLTNSGLIDASTATFRAIRMTTNLANVSSASIVNNAGATIQSADDAIQINGSGTSNATTTARFSIDNAGTIKSATGQALDFDNLSSSGASVLITNRAGGVITADNADAIRPGQNFTINNYGQIIANAVPVPADRPGADGIDLQVNHSGTVNNFSGGLISGAKSGTASDVGSVITVNNAAGATIIGRNGAGIGSGGNAIVVNRGTLTGAIDNTSVRGDGDGIDVDFLLTLTNYGLIQGTGAKGTDAGDRFNNSEGLAVGGGTVRNYGTITGANAGIVVNNDSNPNNSRSGSGALDLINYAGGNIVGQTSYAIRSENKTGTAIDNDVIVNYGTITGNGTIPDPNGVTLLQSGNPDPGSVGTLNGVTYTGAGATRFIRGDGAAIQTGEGNDVLANYGAIIGNNGRAISLEGGNDTLNLYTGSSITGRIDGGVGVNTINLLTSGSGTGNLANVINFQVLNVNSGTWSLLDAQSYANGVTVASGATLQFGNGNAGGEIVGNVVNNGALAFNRSDALTYAGVISGSGAVSQIGAGMTTLTGVNTYTGTTTVSSGTLAIAAGGSIASDVTNAAIFTNAGTVTGTLNNTGTFTNTISGSVGGRLNNMAGTAINAGALNGGTTISGGTLTTTGLVNGGLTNSAIVNANGGAINGAIANTAGTLSVGGSVTSNSTFTNANGATLAIAGTGNYTVQGLVTNSGSLTVANGGTLVATTGGLTNTATGNIDVAQGGTLRDDLNNAGSVTNNGAYIANVASNSGAITNGNTATWTGNVASSTGIIVNNGVWAGTINSAGSLSGNGSVAGLNVTGGTFAPGNGSAGSSMSIAGNLALASAVQYVVQVSSTTASFTNVGGTAALGSAAVSATFANGNYVAKQYTILTAAAGRTGTFGTLTSTNLPSNFNANLSYDATRAYLDLTLNFSRANGLNQNQQNVANTLTDFFTRTGGIPLAFGSLSAAGLSQVSGEVATGTQQATFDAMNLFMGVLTDPFNGNRGESAQQGSAFGYADEALNYAAKRKTSDALAAIYRKAPPPIAAPLQRWSVWSAGFGGSQTTDGNTALGSNTATSRVYGGAVGLDYRFSPYTLAGVALAGGGTSFSVANSGTGRSDLFQAGAFVRHVVGPSYITAALAYGWQDVTTDRSVGADRLNARFTTDTFAGRVEGGYRVVDPIFASGFTPYAAGQFTTIDLPDYRETAGATNTFGLNYAGKDVTASRSELGLRTDKSYAMQDGIVTLRGRAAWAHNFNPDRSINATFQTLPGASFTVNGAAQARDAALVTASAEMTWRSGWAVAATFEGEFSDVTRSYAGKGVVRYGW